VKIYERLVHQKIVCARQKLVVEIMPKC